MADNSTRLDAASATETIASDDIGGAKYQRVKICGGVDGAANDIVADDASFDSYAATKIGVWGNSRGYVYNGSNWDRARVANTLDGGSGVGLQGVSPMIYDGAVYRVVRAAAALGDGNSLSQAPPGAEYLFNETNWDRRRGNTDSVIIAALAARTTVFTSPVFTNYNGRGVHLTINVTAASGTGGVLIQLMGSVSGGGNYQLLGQGININSINYQHLIVYPGITPVSSAGIIQVSCSVPRGFVVIVQVGNATSYTYEIKAGVIV